MRYSIIPTLVLLSGLCAASASAEPVSMKLKFPAGQVDKLSMTMDLDQTISSDAQPGPQRQQVKMGMDITLKVLNSDASGATVEMTFDRMSMQMSVAGRELKFDSASDKPGSENPLSGMGAVVGVKLTVHFDADGKADKVDGVDEMTKKVTAAANGTLAAELLQRSLNADQIKQTFNTRFAQALPGKPIDVGGTWQSTLTQNVDGLNVKLTTDNKLVSIDEKAGHKIAKMEFSGKGTIEGNPTSAPKLKLDELTVKGTKSFDLDRGFFSDSDMQQTMKGTITAGKATLKMDQTVTAKMTIASGAK